MEARACWFGVKEGAEGKFGIGCVGVNVCIMRSKIGLHGDLYWVPKVSPDVRVVVSTPGIPLNTPYDTG